MLLRCIIVDDEPASRDILRRYLADIPQLQLVAECRDAFEATARLAENEIELVFLDINMPRLSGISFARSLHNKPEIIFTTAYPDFAVEGFELNAADYLVKPFSFERFLKAVNRARERVLSRLPGRSASDSILVRSGKKIYALNSEEIKYIEGCGDYIRLHCREMDLTVHETMKGFLSTLPGEHFFRCHKSYAVRIQAISYLEGNRAFIGKQPIPVSPDKKQELIERLGRADQ